MPIKDCTHLQGLRGPEEAAKCAPRVLWNALPERVCMCGWIQCFDLHITALIEASGHLPHGTLSGSGVLSSQH